MGLFKPNTKKDDYVAEEHGPVYNFFHTYLTHMGQMMTANIMFVILNIPMYFVAFGFAVYFLPLFNENLEQHTFVEYWGTTLGAAGNDDLGNIVVGTEAGYQLYFILMVFCVMFLVGTALICIGPFQAGFNQLYRNLHRQEGIFLLSDFKDGVKNNWKQSLGAMGIGLVVTAAIFFGFAFYSNLGNKIGVVLATIFAIFFLEFILIQNIAYQLIVSVDLPLTKIYKNAIFFAILKLGPSLGVIASIVLLLVIIPFAMLFSTNYGLMGFTIFYYATFIFTFVQYMLAYLTGECVDEYIVSKLPPKEDEDEFEYYPDEEESDSEYSEDDDEDESEVTDEENSSEDDE